jgi:hypothetical protein
MSLTRFCEPELVFLVISDGTSAMNAAGNGGAAAVSVNFGFDDMPNDYEANSIRAINTFKIMITVSQLTSNKSSPTAAAGRGADALFADNPFEVFGDFPSANDLAESVPTEPTWVGDFRFSGSGAELNLFSPTP